MESSATKQRIACKAVISHKGKVLLLREAAYKDGTNPGRYHVPGGRVEVGEPFMEGLHREILEETGMSDVRVIKPIYVGEWFPVIHEVKTQIVATFFACETDTDQVRLSEEHDGYQWVDATDWQDIDVMPPETEVLKAYFAEFSQQTS